MKLGKYKKLIFIVFFLHFNTFLTLAEDRIESVPLVNLEELSPTFEEEKDELEKTDITKTNLDESDEIIEKSNTKKEEKIYINLKALDKITAKTSAI